MLLQLKEKIYFYFRKIGELLIEFFFKLFIAKITYLILL